MDVIPLQKVREEGHFPRCVSAAQLLLFLLFLTFSVLVANPKKLLYTVANPARGLLNREKRTKEKVWQHTPHPPPPPPHRPTLLVWRKINQITRRIYRRYAGLGRSLFSWRCLAASTSSFLHAAMNLRRPSVTVSTHTSAFKAVAFQSPAILNAWMSLWIQSVHSFSFPPRPLRTAPSRFPKTIRFGSRLPLIRRSVIINTLLSLEISPGVFTKLFSYK